MCFCEERSPPPLPGAPPTSRGPHQHFAVDALGQREPLEHLTEKLIHLGRVLGLHLALEPVDLVHVVRLVVAWPTEGLERTLGFQVVVHLPGTAQ